MAFQLTRLLEEEALNSV